MTSDGPSAVLSFDQIKAILDDVRAEAQAGRQHVAWQKAQPLQEAQPLQPDAAMALLWAVDQRSFQRQTAIQALSEIAQSHDNDVQILSSLGECLEAVRDIDDLSAPPPGDLIFRVAPEKLDALARVYDGQPEQERILRALASSARMLARQHDAIAERSYRKLTEINPRKERIITISVFSTRHEASLQRA